MAFNLKETYRDNCPRTIAPPHNPPPTIAPLRTTPRTIPRRGLLPPQDNSPQDNPPPTIASNDKFLSSGSSNGRGGGAENSPGEGNCPRGQWFRGIVLRGQLSYKRRKNGLYTTLRHRVWH